MQTTKLSVIIPTHDRRDDVFENVRALSPQCAGQPIEIIVVDSGSAPAVALELEALRQFPNVTLLRENRSGASLARNVGIKFASGEWIAFLDDDATPRPDWAKRVLDRISAGPDNLGAIGARVVAKWPSETTELASSDIGPRAMSILSVLDDTRSYDATVNPVAIGANMIVRKAPLDQIGGFPLHLGPIGKRMICGEDPWVVNAVVALGYSAWYDGEIVVDHKVTADRMSLAWLSSRALQEGAARFRLRRERVGKWLDVVKCTATLPVLALVSNSYDPRSEYLVRFNHNVGYVRAALGIPP